MMKLKNADLYTFARLLRSLEDLESLASVPDRALQPRDRLLLFCARSRERLTR